MIISITNQKIKDAVKLRSSSARSKHNLFIFEGAREIMLALSGGVTVTDLFVCKKLCKDLENQAISKAKEKNVNIDEVAEKVYDKLSYGNRRDGLIAIADIPKYRLSDIRLKKNPLLVIAEAIEKPGNLGAILRTVDACGVDNLIVSNAVSDIYNHHVVRSSVGTVFVKPIVSVSLKDLYVWLKKNNITIICADPNGSCSYTSADFKGPVAIVLGNEKKGVSRFWKEKADITSFIPMKGEADSLNVSITAAAFIFEAVKQRS